MIIMTGLLEPFIYKSDYHWALMNETFIIVINYHMFTFTDWVPDGVTRQIVGYSLIGLASLQTLINLGLALFESFSLLCRKIRLDKLR